MYLVHNTVPGDVCVVSLVQEHFLMPRRGQLVCVEIWSTRELPGPVLHAVDQHAAVLTVLVNDALDCTYGNKLRHTLRDCRDSYRYDVIEI